MSLKIYYTNIFWKMNEQLHATVSFDESPYFSSFLPQQNINMFKCRSKLIYTDEAIIAGLKEQDLTIIKYIYKQYLQSIRGLITTNSGTQMDAEDVFQDAMVIIYQKISSGNLKLTCSFKTYLYSVCRYIWLQKLNKREYSYDFKEVVNPDEYQDHLTLDEHLEEFEKYKLYQQHFLKLKQNDQKVLRLFMNKISLKQIAHIMGYKSEEYAKVRKYICKEKLKNSILNDPQYQLIYQNER